MKPTTLGPRPPRMGRFADEHDKRVRAEAIRDGGLVPENSEELTASATIPAPLGSAAEYEAEAKRLAGV